MSWADEAENDPRHPVRYELTVTGALGPVLRTALAPCDVTLVDVHTVLRTSARDGFDLVDVVAALERTGLEIVDVAALR